MDLVYFFVGVVALFIASCIVMFAVQGVVYFHRKRMAARAANAPTIYNFDDGRDRVELWRDDNWWSRPLRTVTIKGKPTYTDLYVPTKYIGYDPVKNVTVVWRH